MNWRLWRLAGDYGYGTFMGHMGQLRKLEKGSKDSRRAHKGLIDNIAQFAKGALKGRKGH